jgi:hypothetical protein
VTPHVDAGQERAIGAGRHTDSVGDIRRNDGLRGDN